MPAIFDFDLTLTIAHTFPEHRIERAPLGGDQYVLRKEHGTNIKRGVDSVLKHDEQGLSAVATYHNNPAFVAGNISAILGKELTFSRTITKPYDDPLSSGHQTEIAMNVYRVEGIDKPFLISYLPQRGKEHQSAIGILKNKNAQISAIREFWLTERYINSTDDIDFYEDSRTNFNHARSLGYINGYLVSEGWELTVAASYKAPRPTPQSRQPEETNSLSIGNISMMVLGGFIAAAGIAAVALAFTLLNAATFGVGGLVVAGTGIAAIISGGFFAANAYKNRDTNPDDVVGSPDSFGPQLS